MARRRQWYEDVMDVALRATLKEFGFKRKSRTNYICEHSPDRVWIFKIELSRHHLPFRDWSGIFVPEIENIVTRVAPEIGTNETFLRHPSQFRTSIADLVKISRGWDLPTWEKKHSKLWHLLLGLLQPPPATKAIPLWDGGFWNIGHAKAVLARRRTARELVMRNIEIDSREPGERDWQETAEAVGRELDMLWRTYALDWLRKCDNPHFLAEWFDKQIYSEDSVGRTKPAVTAATAWYLAGNSSRAAEILNCLVANHETILGDRAKDTGETADYFRNCIKAAHKLADEFGIALRPQRLSAGE